MKNKMKILIGVAAVMLAMVTVTLADNYSSYYVNTTNNVVVGATTNQANVVAAATTNTFTLSLTAGYQAANAGTNIWPACPLTVQDNIYNPSRALTIQEQHVSYSSSTGTYVERYASTTDGIHWQTNPCPLVLTYTEAGTSGVQIMTNIDTYGVQGYCLFTRENTNAVAITNTWIGTGFDRGL